MDYYSILGVSKNASPDEIKKAFRKLATEHHPDKGGDQKKFVQVKEAYDTLKNPQLRKSYDQQQQTPNDAGWNRGPRTGSYRGTGQNPFENSAFNDIYEQMMRQQRAYDPDPTNTHRTQYIRPNKDITIAARITLEEVFTGKSLIANYKLGSGKKETVNIDIPSGATENNRIRFKDLGDDSFPGPRGNLFVKIEISPHDKWIRKNDDLYTEHSVNALDMIVGGVTIVQALDGKEVRLNIPQGSSCNNKFKLPEFGLPNIKTGKRGNAYVILKPIIPEIKDENVIKKLRKIRNNLDK